MHPNTKVYVVHLNVIMIMNIVNHNSMYYMENILNPRDFNMQLSLHGALNDDDD